MTLDDVAAAAQAVKTAVRERCSALALWGKRGTSLVAAGAVPAAMAGAGLLLLLCRKTRPWAAVACAGVGVWAGLALAKSVRARSDAPRGGSVGSQ
ncbi:MAG: hypothetical protein ACE5O2_11475 [Armatimonadota bacterium]